MSLWLPPYGIKTDLVSCWGFNEGVTGITSYDSHGSNHLSDNGSVDIATGKIGRAINCGASDYKSKADDASLDIGDTLFSSCGWVQLASKSGNQTAWGKYNSTGNQRGYELEYNQTADRFRLFVSGDGTSGTVTSVDANSFGSPSTGVWYLVYFEHDPVANTIGISVNDGTLDTASHSTGIFANTSAFIVGAVNAGGAQLWSGLLDEIALWKGSKRSAYDRSWLFNRNLGRAYGELPGTVTAYETMAGPISAPIGRAA